MKINARKKTVTYSIDEISDIAKSLRNIRTRSENANNIDNAIAINDLADLMGIELPPTSKQ